MDYFLILSSVVFTTGGQLLQKIGANKAAAMPMQMHFITRVLCQAETWWAIACLGLGTMLWLAVLYQMQVSKAFPFLSIGFVMVILISRYFLNEQISSLRWFGLTVICSGIILISQS
jgi:undecaprenyl phosphate-alpha-L-ara4N flippase subunit ArnE